jgi:phosphoribosylglycinamide formyltransferase-1
MTTTNNQIIFFGNEQLAQGIKASTPIFDALIENHYQICALVLPAARVRKPFPIAVKAQQAGIPIHYVSKASELLPIIEQYHPQLGVLAAFGKLVPDSAINAIPGGIINIHPSLLPSFKGAHAIQDAVDYGVKIFGVTTHFVDETLDGGRIIDQGAVVYEGDDIEELTNLIHNIEHKLYVKTINKLINNKF